MYCRLQLQELLHKDFNWLCCIRKSWLSSPAFHLTFNPPPPLPLLLCLPLHFWGFFLSFISCFFTLFSPFCPLPCVLVILTGYGNIAPRTVGGKIFCILYAIFGIPLFGFLLAGIGDQLGTIFVKSILRVEKIFRVSCKYHNESHSLCLHVVVLCSSSWYCMWMKQTCKKLQHAKYYAKISVNNKQTFYYS